jgi:hypothetical protein
MPDVQRAILFLRVQTSVFDVGRLQIFTTRQEGLEPPTDGFGDRYSTN